MIKVQSSNIDSVGWEPTESAANNPLGDLMVVFNNGGRYVYHGVVESVAMRLALSPSSGKFLNENVKDKYEHQKLVEGS